MHDAAGNIMATYQWINRDTFNLDALVMYGSSRLGTYGVNHYLTDTTTRDSAWCAEHDTSTNPFTDSVTYFTAGLKQYEFTNHLGNVLLTLTDRHIPFYFGGVSYIAEVASAQDYYPFGMIMPGRAYMDSTYRFGFNKGSEKDNEINGNGNEYSTLFRELDTRLGRWWTPDPKSALLPWETPYDVTGGNPIWRNDPKGDKWKDKESKKEGEKLIKNLSAKIKTAKEEYDQSLADAKKLADKGSDKFNEAMDKVEEISKKVHALESSKKELEIMGDENTKQVFGFKRIFGNVGYTGKNDAGEIIMEYNSDINAIHESTHGYQQYIGTSFKAASTETEAYKRQYFYSQGEYDINLNPVDINKSVPSLKTVSDSRDINAEWLYGIQGKGEDGKPLYTPEKNPDIYVDRPNW